MKRIMLACASGMSTSLLVEKMKEASKTYDEEYVIWAVALETIQEEIGNFDVLLLGPQISIYKDRIEKIVAGAAPIAVIKPSDYGRCNGKAVLKQAIEMLK